MKKLLDSDLLRAVQWCKLHIIILDYDWRKDNMNFAKLRYPVK